MRYLVALPILVTFALFVAQPAVALRIEEAEVAVEAQLNRLGVDRTRIKSVFLAPNSYPRGGPAHSYTGWITFTDCRGNLVIDLTQIAAVRSLYTTGDCHVPGVD